MGSVYGEAMRTFRCIILLSILAPTWALFAAETPAGPTSDYDRAVKAYVDAAVDQLRSIRSQLNAMAGVPPVEQSKQRLEKVYAILGACDKLLAELKMAGPQDFDPAKTKFEKAHSILLKALDTARKG
jgi:hypothetical protein